jgi:branched-chain amino acid transport system ATP-binding protein
MTDALAVSDMSVEYGGFRAVNAVSLSVPEGQIHGLIGPNGAGKTSLFNAICGYVRPRTGRVTVHGHPLKAGSPHAAWKAGLGRTFQKAELFWTLTVRDHMDLAGRRAKRRNLAPPTTEHLLDLLGLTAIADHTVANLPLGTMRLVELGRALATGSSLLLMDEPCSGLDRSETVEFERVLRSVHEAMKLTFLIVEHDMEFVLSIAGHIVVLDAGRVIASGGPAQITRDPAVHEAYLGAVATKNGTSGQEAPAAR